MYGLYLHIPYCVSKCRYCDFVSGPGSEKEQEAYVDALIREMALYEGTEVDTVFLGGGTPTALPASLLKRLLKAVRTRFKLAQDTEFSSEANPKTVDREKLSVMRDYGVNRLSIGVQSFQDRELQLLGRAHHAADACRTVEMAKEYCHNINLDIMTAIPGQTAQSLYHALETAVSLEPEHLSCYSLIIEEGTPFFDAYEQGTLILPDEEQERQLYHMAGELLKQHGYIRYEISNYAKPGFFCRHNIKYWECREYIGLGAAAHSYMGNRRFFNTRDVGAYIKNPLSKIQEEVLTQKDAMAEFMFMGLRMDCGVREDEFYGRFQKNIREIYRGALEKNLKNGLLESYGGAYRLTERGRDLANTVMCEFL